MAHYFRAIGQFGRGHRYEFSGRDAPSWQRLVDEVYTAGRGKPDAWVVSWLKDEDDPASAVTLQGPTWNAVVGMLRKQRKNPREVDVTLTVRAWTIYGVLPDLAIPVKAAPPLTEAQEAIVKGMVGAAMDQLEANERLGQDTGRGLYEPELQPPLDEWETTLVPALVAHAKEESAKHSWLLDRAYYDKTTTHTLFLGGRLGDAPLVYFFNPVHGGGQWTGTFDLDDGFSGGDLGESMLAAGKAWIAGGQKWAKLPFLEAWT
jgi:hypothetical protein